MEAIKKAGYDGYIDAHIPATPTAAKFASLIEIKVFSC